MVFLSPHPHHQNKVLRLKSGHNRHCPTSLLLDSAGDLSVQQRTAYFTLLSVFKANISSKPEYIHEKMKIRKPNDNGVLPQRQMNKIQVPRYDLSVSRGSFFYRGSQLFNSLPESLRTQTKMSSFKRGIKKWTKEHVAIKPP